MATVLHSKLKPLNVNITTKKRPKKKSVLDGNTVLCVTGLPNQ